jgi:thiamine biosynthesis lipoprotein
VIDPATGAPVDAVWRTVSVAAANCLDANIASTAAIVAGGSAVQWLSSLGLAARLVGADGDVVHVAGWPTQGEELPVRQEALR